jgi:hypothetical protein
MKRVSGSTAITLNTINENSGARGKILMAFKPELKLISIRY